MKKRFPSIVKASLNEYISPKSSIFINTLVDHTILRSFKNSLFLNLVLKDGIVDFLLLIINPHLLLKKEDPKHRIFQFIAKGKNKEIHSTVYFDFFGRSLSHRGYRQGGFRAPCRENVAGSMFTSGWVEPKGGNLRRSDEWLWNFCF